MRGHSLQLSWALWVRERQTSGPRPRSTGNREEVGQELISLVCLVTRSRANLAQKKWKFRTEPFFILSFDVLQSSDKF